MKRYLFDTNAIGHFVNRSPAFEEKIRANRSRGAQIGTCIPAVGEFLYGLELSTSRERNLERAMRSFARLRIWPYSWEAAVEFGRVRAQLDRIGRRMQSIDIQIAAIALTLGSCVVVSTDSDLVAVPGLTVENWAT